MRQNLTAEREREIMKALESFDTPTVTNAVATYPDRSACLGLYHPWDTNWYTDQSLKLMFPELGRTCGYAVTCVYGLPDPTYKNLSIGNVLSAISDSPKPVVLCIKQDYPEHIKRKNGLCGGMMSTAFKSAGVRCIVSDGPSRDVEEVRALEMQYMLTGITPGHGPSAVKAVGVPVSICGMDVCLGDVIHLDENGAVKFPREYLEDVLKNCEALALEEEKQREMLASTDNPELLAKYMAGIYE